jgi:alkylhydroperoxidase family enzyme
VLAAWREAGDLFSARERAVLELAESMTLLADRGVSHQVYRAVSAAFTSEQVAALIMAISVINAFNRLGVAAGAVPLSRD